ncbi:hypothetical protein HMPREF9447_04159 [Bacteroides oleiciplenus YIT 12058]|uniref:Uncharacterized protein n=1 Tax=Bacteroides oleiciplenus YIT 12058 TaxID=742727 RepID=K9DUE0_9BACE|nr:hypothetical protein HMPREF9447_04159 [Bacteroides oleiciplenus YIT 12058]
MSVDKITPQQGVNFQYITSKKDIIFQVISGQN